MMKFKNSITLLVICILVLSFTAAAYGVFSNQGPGQYDFKSIHGETIKIYGKGLYQYDSVSTAVQGIAQDKVTLFMGLPLLAISLYLSRKGLLKGRLLLAGTLGYFLYTYISYSFLSMYNPLFLVYVMLMSASFFAFTLTMMSIETKKLSWCFNPKMPVKFLGTFLIIIGASVALMWSGRIIPPLVKGTPPLGLEHYTTLVIQAMDLGFVVPAAILSGVLVLRKKPYGYLLGSVVTIKGITMLTAITAMIIGMVSAGVKVTLMEMLLFPAFNLVIIYCLVLILKNIRETQYH